MNLNLSEFDRHLPRTFKRHENTVNNNGFMGMMKTEQQQENTREKK